MSISPVGIYRYDITALIHDIDWEPMARPVIREHTPQGLRPQDPNATEVTDPIDKKFLRFRRVIIIQRGSQTPTELGFGRTLEGRDSTDDYLITIKGGSPGDAQNIFERLRQGLIEEIKIENREDRTEFQLYNQIEFSAVSDTARRGGYILDFTIMAHKAGKRRPYGEGELP